MTVLKSEYAARINGELYQLDRAPFPKSPSKHFEGFTVSLDLGGGLAVAGESTLGGATGSSKEHYYTYFMFDGESYSFKRGVDVPRDAHIILERVAPVKRVAAPKPEVEAAPEPEPEVEAAPEPVAEVEAAPAKPKRVRKPKAA